MKERIEKRTRKKKKSIVSRILISNNLEKIWNVALNVLIVA